MRTSGSTSERSELERLIADLLEMHLLFSTCPNSLRSDKGRLLLKSRRISRRDPFGQTHHRRLAG